MGEILKHMLNGAKFLPVCQNTVKRDIQVVSILEIINLTILLGIQVSPAFHVSRNVREYTREELRTDIKLVQVFPC